MVLIIGIVCLMIGIMFLIPPKSQTQNVPDEKRPKVIHTELTRRLDWFRKVSSTAKPVDEGNRIVAIRRIKLNFEDLDEKRSWFINQKDLIQIEVFSKVQIPVTNASQYLIIGDRWFEEPSRSSDNRTGSALLTPEEFAEIKDGSIISYVIAPGSFTNDAWLKESYKNGEPKQIPGAKFGRLDKSMIERFPVIEENRRAQILRIANTINKEQ